MSAEMKKIQTQTKEMRTRVTVNGDGGSGDEVCKAWCHLKPLPPTANLFVDFCDHLFLMGKRVNPVLIEEYGRHITRIAVSLFEAIAQALNLELSGDQRSELLSESTGLIRVYRYPQSSSVEAEGEALGMELHTDSSVISILKEDETGGLEIMKGEEWLRVKPVADTLIINLGDMMQAISDDEYKSVKHRVKKKDRTRERHSVCYFVFPQRDCVIKSSNYKPFTYSEFEAQVQADFQYLGTKVGLHRFSPKSPLFL
ncbi:gibberellin 2-beta-dioxygenase 8 [Brassica rapa]|nr:gibberellin 2-beta-dioxygenase 8 [Brassica rapa]